MQTGRRESVSWAQQGACGAGRRLQNAKCGRPSRPQPASRHAPMLVPITEGLLGLFGDSWRDGESRRVKLFTCASTCAAASSSSDSSHRRPPHGAMCGSAGWCAVAATLSRGKAARPCGSTEQKRSTEGSTARGEAWPRARVSAGRQEGLQEGPPAAAPRRRTRPAAARQAPPSRRASC